jgi:hypothetical protein
MLLPGPRPARATVTILLCAVALLGPGSPASAYDFEITSRTEAYGYQLRRYFLDGIQFLNRRRVHQWLGLRVFNLLEPGQEPWSPRGRGGGAPPRPPPPPDPPPPPPPPGGGGGGW